MGFKRFLKTTAMTLAIALIAQDISWAAASLGERVPVRPEAKGSGLAGLVANPLRIDLPAGTVQLKEAHAGSNGRLLVLIEDPHGNYEGQKNIAAAIRALSSTYGIRTVLLEGGSRRADLGSLRAVVGPRELKLGAEQLLREGILSGPEHLSLTGGADVELHGVENTRHYGAALLAYARVASVRGAASREWQEVRNALQAFKDRLYPDTLLDYERAKREAGADGSIRAIDGLLKLADAARVSLNAYPSFLKLKVLKWTDASMNYEALSLEQDALLRRLESGPRSQAAQALADGLGRAALPAERERLVRSLLDLAEGEYPHLRRYAEYLGTFRGMDWDALARESEELEARSYRQLLPDEDARKIALLGIYFDLIQKAFDLKLTSREFRQLRQNRKYFESGEWKSFLHKKSDQLGLLDVRIPETAVLDRSWSLIRAFYTLVNLRDHSLVARAGRTLDASGQKAAVLIAGGYHTDHLKELLAQEGYGWAILTPQVRTQTDRVQYEKILLMPLKRGINTSASPGVFRHIPKLALADTGVFDSMAAARLAGAEGTESQIRSALSHLRQRDLREDSGARLASGQEDETLKKSGRLHLRGPMKLMLIADSKIRSLPWKLMHQGDGHYSKRPDESDPINPSKLRTDIKLLEEELERTGREPVSDLREVRSERLARELAEAREKLERYTRLFPRAEINLRAVFAALEDERIFPRDQFPSAGQVRRNMMIAAVIPQTRLLVPTPSFRYRWGRWRISRNRPMMYCSMEELARLSSSSGLDGRERSPEVIRMAFDILYGWEWYQQIQKLRQARVTAGTMAWSMRQFDREWSLKEKEYVSSRLRIRAWFQYLIDWVQTRLQARKIRDEFEQLMLEAKPLALEVTQIARHAPRTPDGMIDRIQHEEQYASASKKDPAFERRRMLFRKLRERIIEYQTGLLRLTHRAMALGEFDLVYRINGWSGQFLSLLPVVDTGLLIPERFLRFLKNLLRTGRYEAFLDILTAMKNGYMKVQIPTLDARGWVVSHTNEKISVREEKKIFADLAGDAFHQWIGFTIRRQLEVLRTQDSDTGDAGDSERDDYEILTLVEQRIYGLLDQIALEFTGAPRHPGVGQTRLEKLEQEADPVLDDILRRTLELSGTKVLAGETTAQKWSWARKKLTLGSAHFDDLPFGKIDTVVEWDAVFSSRGAGGKKLFDLTEILLNIASSAIRLDGSDPAGYNVTDPERIEFVRVRMKLVDDVIQKLRPEGAAYESLPSAARWWLFHTTYPMPAEMLKKRFAALNEIADDDTLLLRTALSGMALRGKSPRDGEAEAWGVGLFYKRLLAHWPQWAKRRDVSQRAQMLIHPLAGVDAWEPLLSGAEQAGIPARAYLGEAVAVVESLSPSALPEPYRWAVEWSVSESILYLMHRTEAATSTAADLNDLVIGGPIAADYFRLLERPSRQPALDGYERLKQRLRAGQGARLAEDAVVAQQVDSLAARYGEAARFRILDGLEKIRIKAGHLELTDVQTLENIRTALSGLSEDERMRHAALDDAVLYLERYLDGQLLMADWPHERTAILKKILSADWKIFESANVGTQVFVLKSMTYPDLVLKIVPKRTHPLYQGWVRIKQTHQDIIRDVLEGALTAQNPELRGSTTEPILIPLSAEDIASLSDGMREMISDEFPYVILQKRHRLVRRMDYPAYFRLFKELLRKGYIFADIFSLKQLGYRLQNPDRYILLDTGSVRPLRPGDRAEEYLYNLLDIYPQDADSGWAPSPEYWEHYEQVRRFLKELEAEGLIEGSRLAQLVPWQPVVLDLLPGHSTRIISGSQSFVLALDDGPADKTSYTGRPYVQMRELDNIYPVTIEAGQPPRIVVQMDGGTEPLIRINGRVMSQVHSNVYFGKIEIDDLGGGKVEIRRTQAGDNPRPVHILANLPDGRKVYGARLAGLEDPWTVLMRGISGGDPKAPGSKDGSVARYSAAYFGLLDSRGLLDGQTVIYPAAGYDGYIGLYAPTVAITRSDERIDFLEHSSRAAAAGMLGLPYDRVRMSYVKGDILDDRMYAKARSLANVNSADSLTLLIKGLRSYVFGFREQAKADADLGNYLKQAVRLLRPAQIIVSDAADLDVARRVLTEGGEYTLYDEWLSREEKEALESSLRAVAGSGSTFSRFNFMGVNVQAPTAAAVFRRNAKPASGARMAWSWSHDKNSDWSWERRKEPMTKVVRALEKMGISRFYGPEGREKLPDGGPTMSTLSWFSLPWLDEADRKFYAYIRHLIEVYKINGIYLAPGINDLELGDFLLRGDAASGVDVWLRRGPEGTMLELQLAKDSRTFIKLSGQPDYWPLEKQPGELLPEEGQDGARMAASDRGRGSVATVYFEGEPYAYHDSGAQGSVYVNHAKGLAIKIFDQIPGVTTRVLDRVVEVNGGLKRHGLDVVEMLGVIEVRTGAGETAPAIWMRYVEGESLEDLYEQLIQSSASGAGAAIGLASRAEILLDEIDALTGGLADRRFAGGLDARPDLSNFVQPTGSGAVNVDPLEVGALRLGMDRESRGNRQSLRRLREPQRVGDLWEAAYELSFPLTGKPDERIVFYVDYPDGEGPFPTAFIVHGWQSSASEPLIAELARAVAGRGFAVVRPDLRGHRGRVWDETTRASADNRNASSGDVSTFTWGDSIDDLHRILSSLRTAQPGMYPRMDLERTFWFGHSYGGWTVERIASLAAGGNDPRFAGLKIGAVFGMASPLDPSRALLQIIRNGAFARSIAAAVPDYRLEQKWREWRTAARAPIGKWQGFKPWFAQTGEWVNDPFDISFMQEIPHHYVVGQMDNLMFLGGPILAIFYAMYARFINLHAPASLTIVKGMGHFFEKKYRTAVIQKILDRLDASVRPAGEAQVPAVEMLDIDQEGSPHAGLDTLFPIQTNHDRAGALAIASVAQFFDDHPRFIPTHPGSRSQETASRTRLLVTDDGSVQVRGGEGVRKIGYLELLAGPERTARIRLEPGESDRPAVWGVAYPLLRLALALEGWNLEEPDAFHQALDRPDLYFVTRFAPEGTPEVICLKYTANGVPYMIRLQTDEGGHGSERAVDRYYRIEVIRDPSGPRDGGDYAGGLSVTTVPDGTLQNYDIDISRKRTRRFPWLEGFLSDWLQPQRNRSFDWFNPDLTSSSSPVGARMSHQKSVRHFLNEALKLTGWVGIAYMSVVALSSLSPQVYWEYAWGWSNGIPTMLKGWSLLALIIFASQYPNKWKQVAIVGAPIGLMFAFGLDHMNLQNLGRALARVCTVFVTIFVAKTMREEGSIADRVSSAWGWALSSGLIGSFHQYTVWLPFVLKAIPDAAHRSAFDIGIAANLVHTPLSLTMAFVFGEKINLWRELRQQGLTGFVRNPQVRMVLEMLPYNFCYWYPVTRLAYGSDNPWNFFAVTSVASAVWVWFVSSKITRIATEAAKTKPAPGPKSSHGDGADDSGARMAAWVFLSPLYLAVAGLRHLAVWIMERFNDPLVVRVDLKDAEALRKAIPRLAAYCETIHFLSYPDEDGVFRHIDLTGTRARFGAGLLSIIDNDIPTRLLQSASYPMRVDVRRLPDDKNHMAIFDSGHLKSPFPRISAARLSVAKDRTAEGASDRSAYMTHQLKQAPAEKSYLLLNPSERELFFQAESILDSGDADRIAAWMLRVDAQVIPDLRSTGSPWARQLGTADRWLAFHTMYHIDGQQLYEQRLRTLAAVASDETLAWRAAFFGPHLRNNRTGFDDEDLIGIKLFLSRSLPALARLQNKMRTASEEVSYRRRQRWLLNALVFPESAGADARPRKPELRDLLDELTESSGTDVRSLVRSAWRALPEEDRGFLIERPFMFTEQYLVAVLRDVQSPDLTLDAVAAGEAASRRFYQQHRETLSGVTAAARQEEALQSLLIESGLPALSASGARLADIGSRKEVYEGIFDTNPAVRRSMAREWTADSDTAVEMGQVLDFITTLRLPSPYDTETILKAHQAKNPGYDREGRIAHARAAAIFSIYEWLSPESQPHVEVAEARLEEGLIRRKLTEDGEWLKFDHAQPGNFPRLSMSSQLALWQNVYRPWIAAHPDDFWYSPLSIERTLSLQELFFLLRWWQSDLDVLVTHGRSADFAQEYPYLAPLGRDTIFGINQKVAKKLRDSFKFVDWSFDAFLGLLKGSQDTFDHAIAIRNAYDSTISSQLARHSEPDGARLAANVEQQIRYHLSILESSDTDSERKQIAIAAIRELADPIQSVPEDILTRTMAVYDQTDDADIQRAAFRWLVEYGYQIDAVREWVFGIIAKESAAPAGIERDDIDQFMLALIRHTFSARFDWLDLRQSENVLEGLYLVGGAVMDSMREARKPTHGMRSYLHFIQRVATAGREDALREDDLQSLSSLGNPAALLKEIERQLDLAARLHKIDQAAFTIQRSMAFDTRWKNLLDNPNFPAAQELYQKINQGRADLALSTPSRRPDPESGKDRSSLDPEQIAFRINVRADVKKFGKKPADYLESLLNREGEVLMLDLDWFGAGLAEKVLEQLKELRRKGLLEYCALPLPPRALPHLDKILEGGDFSVISRDASTWVNVDYADERPSKSDLKEIKSETLGLLSELRQQGFKFIFYAPDDHRLRGELRTQAAARQLHDQLAKHKFPPTVVLGPLIGSDTDRSSRADSLVLEFESIPSERRHRTIALRVDSGINGFDKDRHDLIEALELPEFGIDLKRSAVIGPFRSILQGDAYQKAWDGLLHFHQEDSDGDNSGGWDWDGNDPPTGDPDLSDADLRPATADGARMAMDEEFRRKWLDKKVQLNEAFADYLHPKSQEIVQTIRGFANHGKDGFWREVANQWLTRENCASNPVYLEEQFDGVAATMRMLGSKMNDFGVEDHRSVSRRQYYHLEARVWKAAAAAAERGEFDPGYLKEFKAVEIALKALIPKVTLASVRVNELYDRIQNAKTADELDAIRLDVDLEPFLGQGSVEIVGGLNPYWIRVSREALADSSDLDLGIETGDELTPDRLAEKTTQFQKGLELLTPEARSAMAAGNNLIIGPGRNTQEIMMLHQEFPQMRREAVIDLSPSNLVEIKRRLEADPAVSDDIRSRTKLHHKPFWDDRNLTGTYSLVYSDFVFNDDFLEGEFRRGGRRLATWPQAIEGLGELVGENGAAFIRGPAPEWRFKEKGFFVRPVGPARWGERPLLVISRSDRVFASPRGARLAEVQPEKNPNASFQRMVTVIRDGGIHLHPSLEIASIARAYQGTEIRLHDGRQSVNAKEMSEIGLLAAGQGAMLTVSAVGPRAEEAVDEITGLSYFAPTKAARLAQRDRSPKTIRLTENRRQEPALIVETEPGSGSAKRDGSKELGARMAAGVKEIGDRDYSVALPAYLRQLASEIMAAQNDGFSVKLRLHPERFMIVNWLKAAGFQQHPSEPGVLVLKDAEAAGQFLYYLSDAMRGEDSAIVIDPAKLVFEAAEDADGKDTPQVLLSDRPDVSRAETALADFIVENGKFIRETSWVLGDMLKPGPARDEAQSCVLETMSRIQKKHVSGEGVDMLAAALKSSGLDPKTPPARIGDAEWSGWLRRYLIDDLDEVIRLGERGKAEGFSTAELLRISEATAQIKGRIGIIVDILDHNKFKSPGSNQWTLLHIQSVVYHSQIEEEIIGLDLLPDTGEDLPERGIRQIVFLSPEQALKKVRDPQLAAELEKLQGYLMEMRRAYLSEDHPYLGASLGRYYSDRVYRMHRLILRLKGAAQDAGAAHHFIHRLASELYFLGLLGLADMNEGGMFYWSEKYPTSLRRDRASLMTYAQSELMSLSQSLLRSLSSDEALSGEYYAQWEGSGAKRPIEKAALEIVRAGHDLRDEALARQFVENVLNDPYFIGPSEGIDYPVVLTARKLEEVPRITDGHLQDLVTVALEVLRFRDVQYLMATMRLTDMAEGVLNPFGLDRYVNFKDIGLLTGFIVTELNSASSTADYIHIRDEISRRRSEFTDNIIKNLNSHRRSGDDARNVAIDRAQEYFHEAARRLGVASHRIQDTIDAGRDEIGPIGEKKRRYNRPSLDPNDPILKAARHLIRRADQNKLFSGMEKVEDLRQANILLEHVDNAFNGNGESKKVFEGTFLQQHLDEVARLRKAFAKKKSVTDSVSSNDRKMLLDLAKIIDPESEAGARMAESKADIRVREAELGDAEQLLPIYRDDYQTIFKGYDPLPDPVMLASLRSYIKGGTGSLVHKTWLATIDGNIGGFLVAGRIGDQGFINVIAVKNEFRRKGAAKALASQAMDWFAHDTPVTYVRVRDLSDGATGDLLARHFGFESKRNEPRTFFKEITPRSSRPGALMAQSMRTVRREDLAADLTLSLTELMSTYPGVGVIASFQFEEPGLVHFAAAPRRIPGAKGYPTHASLIRNAGRNEDDYMIRLAISSDDSDRYNVLIVPTAADGRMPEFAKVFDDNLLVLRALQQALGQIDAGRQVLVYTRPFKDSRFKAHFVGAGMLMNQDTPDSILIERIVGERSGARMAANPDPASAKRGSRAFSPTQGKVTAIFSTGIAGGALTGLFFLAPSFRTMGVFMVAQTLITAFAFWTARIFWYPDWSGSQKRSFRHRWAHVLRAEQILTGAFLAGVPILAASGDPWRSLVIKPGLEFYGWWMAFFAAFEAIHHFGLKLGLSIGPESTFLAGLREKKGAGPVFRYLKGGSIGVRLRKDSITGPRSESQIGDGLGARLASENHESTSNDPEGTSSGLGLHELNLISPTLGAPLSNREFADLLVERAKREGITINFIHGSPALFTRTMWKMAAHERRKRRWRGAAQYALMSLGPIFPRQVTTYYFGDGSGVSRMNVISRFGISYFDFINAALLALNVFSAQYVNAAITGAYFAVIVMAVWYSNKENVELHELMHVYQHLITHRMASLRRLSAMNVINDPDKREFMETSLLRFKGVKHVTPAQLAEFERDFVSRVLQTGSGPESSKRDGLGARLADQSNDAGNPSPQDPEGRASGSGSGFVEADELLAWAGELQPQVAGGWLSRIWRRDPLTAAAEKIAERVMFEADPVRRSAYLQALRGFNAEGEGPDSGALVLDVRRDMLRRAWNHALALDAWFQRRAFLKASVSTATQVALSRYLPAAELVSRYPVARDGRTVRQMLAPIWTPELVRGISRVLPGSTTDDGRSENNLTRYLPKTFQEFEALNLMLKLKPDYVSRLYPIHRKASGPDDSAKFREYFDLDSVSLSDRERSSFSILAYPYQKFDEYPPGVQKQMIQASHQYAESLRRFNRFFESLDADMRALLSQVNPFSAEFSDLRAVALDMLESPKSVRQAKLRELLDEMLLARRESENEERSRTARLNHAESSNDEFAYDVFPSAGTEAAKDLIRASGLKLDLMKRLLAHFEFAEDTDNDIDTGRLPRSEQKGGVGPAQEDPQDESGARLAGSNSLDRLYETPRFIGLVPGMAPKKRRLNREANQAALAQYLKAGRNKFTYWTPGQIRRYLLNEVPKAEQYFSERTGVPLNAARFLHLGVGRGQSLSYSSTYRSFVLGLGYGDWGIEETKRSVKLAIYEELMHQLSDMGKPPHKNGSRHWNKPQRELYIARGMRGHRYLEMPGYADLSDPVKKELIALAKSPHGLSSRFYEEILVNKLQLLTDRDNFTQVDRDIRKVGLRNFKKELRAEFGSGADPRSEKDRFVDKITTLAYMAQTAEAIGDLKDRDRTVRMARLLTQKYIRRFGPQVIEAGAFDRLMRAFRLVYRLVEFKDGYGNKKQGARLAVRVVDWTAQLGLEAAALWTPDIAWAGEQEGKGSEQRVFEELLETRSEPVKVLIEKGTFEGAGRSEEMRQELRRLGARLAEAGVYLEFEGMPGIGVPAPANSEVAELKLDAWKLKKGVTGLVTMKNPPVMALLLLALLARTELKDLSMLLERYQTEWTTLFGMTVTLATLILFRVVPRRLKMRMVFRKYVVRPTRTVTAFLTHTRIALQALAQSA